MVLNFNEIREIGFDYTSLEPDVADEARDAAGQIHKIFQRSTAAIIEVGQRLKTIKDMLPHGQFAGWIAAEFGMSDRAARLYMSAADFAAGRTETVSVLQPTTVYALAAPSTSDNVRVAVVERLGNGEAVTDREVKELISQERARRKQTNEGKAQTTVEADVAGIVSERSEHNDWHLAPVDAHEKAPNAEIEVVRDPLTVAVHTVETLSADDRAAFDQWYRRTYRVPLIDVDVFVDPDQMALALEHPPVETNNHQDKSSANPEPARKSYVVEVDDDPIITMWRELKPNTQKAGCHWVVSGAPEIVPWDEHHVIADRLKLWRESYSAALPERQIAVRRWLETQELCERSKDILDADATVGLIDALSQMGVPL